MKTFKDNLIFAGKCLVILIPLLLVAALPTTLNTNQFNTFGPLSVKSGAITTNNTIFCGATGLNITNVGSGTLVNLKAPSGGNNNFSLVEGGSTKWIIQSDGLSDDFNIVNNAGANSVNINQAGNFYVLNSIFATNFNGYTATTNLIVRKNADQTLDSTTINDDAELQFALAANEKAEFTFRAKFVAGSVAADGLKVTVTNSVTGGYGLWHHRIYVINPVFGTNTSQTTFGTTQSIVTIDADTDVEISGVVVQGGSSGIIKFQWAKNADTGTAHTCKSNAVARIIKF